MHGLLAFCETTLSMSLQLDGLVAIQAKNPHNRNGPPMRLYKRVEVRQRTAAVPSKEGAAVNLHPAHLCGSMCKGISVANGMVYSQ